MAGNKKPRKAYRPQNKRINLDPVGWLLEGAQTVEEYKDGSQFRKLLLKAHSAHAELLSGRGTFQHAFTLKGALEVAEVLAHRHGLGNEHINILVIARAAYTMLYERAMRTKRWVYAGAEVNAMVDLLALHEAQLEVALVNHIDQTINYLRKLDGKNPPWLEQQLQKAAA